MFRQKRRNKKNIVYAAVFLFSLAVPVWLFPAGNVRADVPAVRNMQEPPEAGEGQTVVEVRDAEQMPETLDMQSAPVVQNVQEPPEAGDMQSAPAVQNVQEPPEAGDVQAGIRFELAFPLQEQEGEIRLRAGRDFTMSVKLTAENMDFSGRVNVLMQNAQENNIMFSEAVHGLSEGETCTLSFDLPGNLMTEGLYVTLVDEEGRETAGWQIPVDVVNYGQYKVVGVLAKTAEDYSYFSSFGNETIQMNFKDIEEGTSSLQSLDIIVAEDVMLQEFSQEASAGEVEEVLRDWVGHGKTLVVGMTPLPGDEEEMLHFGLQEGEVLQDLILQISNYELARNSILSANEELRKQHGNNVRTCYIGDSMIWPVLVNNLSDEAVGFAFRRPGTFYGGELLAGNMDMPEAEGGLPDSGGLFADEITSGGNVLPEAGKEESNSWDDSKLPENGDIADRADSAGLPEKQAAEDSAESQKNPDELSEELDAADGVDITGGPEAAYSAAAVMPSWAWWCTDAEPEVVWEEKGQQVLVRYPYGDGNVLVYTIPLAREESSIYPLVYYRIVQLVLENISDKQEIQQDYERYGRDAENYSYLLYYLDGREQGASVLPYLLLIFVYIAIVLPMVFMVLRRRGESKYLWGVLPFCAVFMTGIIYLVGSSTRISKPYCSFIDIVDYTDVGYTTGGVQTVYFQLSAPTNHGAEILLPKDAKVRIEETMFASYDPGVDSYLYYGENTSKAQDYRAAVFLDGEESRLELKNVAAFSDTTFRMQREVPFDGGFAGKYNTNGDMVTGTIYNKTGVNWKGVYLFVEDHIIDLGAVDAGQKMILSDCRQGNLELDNFFNIMQRMSEGRFTAEESSILSNLAWDYHYYCSNSFLIAVSGEAGEEVLGSVASDSHSSGMQISVYSLKNELGEAEAGPDD